MAAVVSVIILAAIVAVGLWQLGLKGHLDPQRWSLLFTGPILSYLGVGLINSLLSGLIAGVIAAPLAVLVAVGRRHGPRWLRWILSGYVELIRSLPLLVLIYFFFLFLPSVEIKVSPLWQLVIPLVLNNVAMISDIFRAGMDGVSRGEIEAAHSLGLPSWRVITITAHDSWYEFWCQLCDELGFGRVKALRWSSQPRGSRLKDSARN